MRCTARRLLPSHESYATHRPDSRRSTTRRAETRPRRHLHHPQERGTWSIFYCFRSVQRRRMLAKWVRQVSATRVFGLGRRPSERDRLKALERANREHCARPDESLAQGVSVFCPGGLDRQRKVHRGTVEPISQGAADCPVDVPRPCRVRGGPRQGVGPGSTG